MKHHSLGIVIGGIAALLLAGCASVTPYQPRQDGYGYFDQKLESNRYRISFTGSAATPRETVENYVLYRAAEITLANGYDYFVVAGGSGTQESSGGGSRSNVGLGFGGFSIGSGGGIGIGIGVGTGGGYDREYRGQAEIVMHKGPKPANDPGAFDARAIKANLETYISRPQGGG